MWHWWWAGARHNFLYFWGLSAIIYIKPVGTPCRGRLAINCGLQPVNNIIQRIDSHQSLGVLSRPFVFYPGRGIMKIFCGAWLPLLHLWNFIGPANLPNTFIAHFSGASHQTSHPSTSITWRLSGHCARMRNLFCKNIIIKWMDAFEFLDVAS